MASSLDILGLFEQYFGYRPVNFNFPPAPVPNKYADLGSKYFSRDATGREYYMPIFLGKMELPNAVMRISGQKEILKTPLQGQRGTVKELINIDDYQITIRGLIIGEEPKYPEGLVKRMRALYERNEAVELRCPISDIFLVTPERKGFDKVVIEAIDFPEVNGTMNVRPYEIRLISDEEFDLFID